MEFDSVINYIFSAEQKPVGVVGEKLVKAATTKSKPVLDKQALKEKTYLDKICGIRDYDEHDNACWVDYRSWCIMPPSLRQTILHILEPKMWRGVVFEYDKFIENEKNIIPFISENIVLVLSLINKKYRIFTIPLYKSYIDWLSPSAFIDLKSKISNNMIKTYGRSKDRVYILDGISNAVCEIIIDMN